MSDLISRQAAINAIRKDVMGGLNYESILKSLPSAEPEIIRCEDCEHYWSSAEICTKWTRHCGGMGYCDEGERRTDEQTVSD